MIKKYVTQYKAILSQKRGIWPGELINDLQNLVNSLTGVLSTYSSINENRRDLLSAGECPGKALKIYIKFDNYFK